MIRDLDAVDPGYWFGRLGQLVALPDLKGSLRVQPTRPSSVDVTVGGRVKVWRSPRVRRVWDCSIPALTPSELGLLQYAEQAAGAWVTMEAAAINILTPEQSEFLDSPVQLTPAGMAQVEPGLWVPQALTATATARPFGTPVPVPPSGKVTLSAWVRGTNVSLGIRNYGATGTNYAAVGSSSEWSRVSRTFDADMINSGQLDVVTSNATSIAGVAVTWTDSIREWGPGRGCANAVLELGQQDLLRTSPTITGVDFTVREVG